MKKSLPYLCILFAMTSAFLYFYSISPPNKKSTPVKNQSAAQAIAKPNPSRLPDPDILDFSMKISVKRIDEAEVLLLLKSSLSQNKKAVILETYWERKNPHSMEEWGDLLLQLIKDADEWPELSNKAADHLALVNKAGILDEKILKQLDDLASDEIVKRSALAFAIGTKDAVQKALNSAPGNDEVEILSEKHASFLTQNERIAYFDTAKSGLSKAAYLKAYISQLSTSDDLAAAINKGFQDPSISHSSKHTFLFTAAESQVKDKSMVLFSYWQSLLPQAKENESIFSTLSLAIPTAAYSDSKSSYAESIMLWLISQPDFDPNDTLDPRIYLSIAMVNACNDPLLEKKHCKSLVVASRDLKEKLKRNGLQTYIAG